MEQTPLDLAYKSSKNADKAVLAGEFEKASDLYKQASEQFESEARRLPHNPACSTIKTLAEFTNKRAHFFRSEAPKELNKQAANNSNSSKSPFRTEIVPSDTPISVNTKQSMLVRPISEMLVSMVTKSSLLFAKTFEQELNQQPTTSSLTAFNPSESFYLVKPKSTPEEEKSRGSKNLEYTPADKSRAIERATQVQKTALGREFNGMKPVIYRLEQEIKEQFIEELDRLRTENEELKKKLNKTTNNNDESNEN